MRVTKNIREFIEREVDVRITPRYESDKVESARQKKALEDFLQACFNEATNAFNKYFDEHFDEVVDFAEDKRSSNKLYMQPSYAATIKDIYNKNSVHGWEYRKRVETKKLVDEIIVNLELGGTKDELMEMLNKIGEGD